jgi:ABC-type lipoprotein export system ATPase subunit
MDAVVSVRGLRFRYGGSTDDVLNIPALDIVGRGLVALTGPSGAGKSTLIELLAGTLREQYEGSVTVLGTELRDLRTDAGRQRHVRRIGLIPQDYALLPGLTVEELLLQDLADAQTPRADRGAKVGGALLAVGLDGFGDRLTNQLSGGQRQRVAIARMLARDVQLVVADEPTANLDSDLVAETVRLFRDLARAVPVILVTHDPTVGALCDRTIVLQSTSQSAVSSPPAQPVGGRRRLVRKLIPMVGALLVATVVAAAVLAGQLGPQRAGTSSAQASPSATASPALAPAPAPNPPSTLPTAPPPTPQQATTVPAPTAVSWWVCESDATPSGQVVPSADAAIQARGGESSAFCDRALKAKGLNKSAWVYKVPVSGGPVVPQYSHCGGTVAHIVGVSDQVYPWNQPVSNQGGFDQDWNPVGLGAC